MNHLYTKIRFFLFAVLTATSLLYSGCTSVQVPGNSGEIREYALSNGIPVYVKKNSENQLVSMYIVVKGGTALLTPDKSGLELALVRMMKSGSAQYTYEQLQALEYRTHADFFGFSQNEGSGLGIECIDYYLDDMLPALTDGFMHPAFGKTEYDTMMKDYHQKLQSTMNSPDSLCYYTLNRTVYKDHPYETSPDATPDSIGNISIDTMKNLHTKLMDARRISVVVVGNVSASGLIKKLDETLGKLPALENSFTVPEIPPVSVSGLPVVLTHQAAAGTGFMYQCFASPSVTSNDYIPACIAADMYSDVLYQIVREKYGACYTPASAVLSSRAAIGLVMLYRVSDPGHAVSYVQEARQLMDQGKLVTGKDAAGNYQYASISDRLESYKNIYINSRYSQMKTNSGVAGKLAASILQFGDPYTADTMIGKARSVTADDIIRVFDTYWVKGNSRWFAVVGPGAESSVHF